MLVSCSAYFSTLKMEAICSSETSVDLERTTRRHISVVVMWPGHILTCSPGICIELMRKPRKPASGWPGTELRFEHRNFRVKSRSANPAIRNCITQYVSYLHFSLLHFLCYWHQCSTSRSHRNTWTTDSLEKRLEQPRDRTLTNCLYLLSRREGRNTFVSK
jgi:hypothetical protein